MATLPRLVWAVAITRWSPSRSPAASSSACAARAPARSPSSRRAVPTAVRACAASAVETGLASGQLGLPAHSFRLGPLAEHPERGRAGHQDPGEQVGLAELAGERLGLGDRAASSDRRHRAGCASPTGSAAPRRGPDDRPPVRADSANSSVRRIASWTSPRSASIVALAASARATAGSSASDRHTATCSSVSGDRLVEPAHRAQQLDLVAERRLEPELVVARPADLLLLGEVRRGLVVGAEVALGHRQVAERRRQHRLIVVGATQRRPPRRASRGPSSSSPDDHCAAPRLTSAARSVARPPGASVRPAGCGAASVSRYSRRASDSGRWPSSASSRAAPQTSWRCASGGWSYAAGSSSTGRSASTIAVRSDGAPRSSRAHSRRTSAADRT